MLLKIENLSVSYASTKALHKVNMHVMEGEIVSFIGYNGAGKSTLLKTISGLLKPDEGTIEWLGKSIVGLQAEKIVRAGISHAPEGRMVFAQSTVRQNLEIGAYIRKDKGEMRKNVEKYFKFFPALRERSKQKAGLLSGGEQQMLSIARALMSHPKMLMLDEPSLGLSPVAVNDVYEEIERIRKDGVTILLVEQNAKKALNISDRAYVIASGEIILEGRSMDLLNNEAVKKAYLGG